eukprot:COSAG04_NODE_2685_length_3740_cov_2.487229_9_plen_141_part_00
MMVESTPEFSHPLSAMYQLWTEGSWMRGWLFSTFIHLSSGDALYRLPWNAVRLRLMTDPNRYVPSPCRSLLFALSDVCANSRLWGAWNAFGPLTPWSGWRAYLWSVVPMCVPPPPANSSAVSHSCPGRATGTWLSARLWS